MIARTVSVGAWTMQASSSDLEYAGKKKLTRRDRLPG